MGKWSKHQLMEQDERLKEYLPHTSLFTPDTLWEYTDRYPIVMVKPSGGQGGAGVIQLTRLEEDTYRIHTGSTKRTIRGKGPTLSYLRSLFIPKPYLLQPRIPLGRINGRPFDLRVMVQRKKGETWRVTGWLAKVAGPGYVVTNIRRSGGKVVPLRTAIELSDVKQSSEILPHVRKVALMTAHRLGNVYKSLRLVGIDMGIDVDGKPWIIEANFRPALSLFQKLQDKTLYNRICSYLKR
ncbi:YheC/YheD family protein [Brevibacillus sp. H7]|uniref:YheC/YheD family protein n=1 Tax=Brevibacillus sp. H7 TaxID=3349138 RepID=UPI0037FFA4BE